MSIDAEIAEALGFTEFHPSSLNRDAWVLVQILCENFENVSLFHADGGWGCTVFNQHGPAPGRSPDHRLGDYDAEDIMGPYDDPSPAMAICKTYLAAHAAGYV